MESNTYIKASSLCESDSTSFNHGLLTAYVVFTRQTDFVCHILFRVIMLCFIWINILLYVLVRLLVLNSFCLQVEIRHPLCQFREVLVSNFFSHCAALLALCLFAYYCRGRGL